MHVVLPFVLTIHLSQLSPQEQKDIVASFSDKTKTQANGLRVAGQKFFTLQVSDRSVYLKKGVWFKSTCPQPPVSSQSYFQGDGVIIVKTKQAILVAEYVAPIQAPEATPVVEGLADYLIGVGY